MAFGCCEAVAPLEPCIGAPQPDGGAAQAVDRERRSGDLALTSNMLGHSSVAITAKRYSDVRSGYAARQVNVALRFRAPDETPSPEPQAAVAAASGKGLATVEESPSGGVPPMVHPEDGRGF